MKRIPIVAGNWKMNKTVSEAAMLAQGVSYGYCKDFKSIDTVLCPPFISLKTVGTVLDYDRSAMKLGAQDVYWQESGAYTGAISPMMLKDLECDFCIVGHSERRQYFKETDEDVARKAKALTDVKIIPIICVGEGLDVRESKDGAAISFVTGQVKAALALLSADEIGKAVIAYEPIWAIGTGRTATPEQAQEMCAAIRSQVQALTSDDVAQKMRILYGGSMKPENAAMFEPMPDIDGGLIGGAALDATGFIEIVKAFS